MRGRNARVGMQLVSPSVLVGARAGRASRWSARDPYQRAAGVALGVDLAQRCDRDQRVDLRRRHRGVPEQLLHDPDVGPALEQVGRERVPQGVRRDVAAQAGPLGAARSTDQALCRESRLPRVLRNTAGVPRPRGREHRPPAHQPGLQGLPGVRAERHERSLLPLPSSRDHPVARPSEVVEVEADGLADAGPGGVEHLEQRAVAQRRRGVPHRRGLEEPLTSSTRDRLGQPLGGAGGCTRRAGSASRHALERQEAVPAPDRDDCAGGRGRGERQGGSPSPSRSGEEVGDVGLADVLGPLDARATRGSAVPVEVTPVGGEGVVASAALDVEVGQPGVDGPAHGRGRGPAAQGGAERQESTSASGELAMPCASATGA